MNKTVSNAYRAAAALLAALAATFAHAALETSDADYNGPFIDLASRVDLGTTVEEGYGYTFGPVDLPGMVFTRSQTATNSGLGAVLGQGGYELDGNGGFGADAVYAGLDGWTGYMDFTLTSGPVSAFGAYVTHATNFTELPSEVFEGMPYIAALDGEGNVIESWNLAIEAPISTPSGFNQFLFRGISRDSADIYGLRFGNAYILAAGTASGGLPTGGSVAPVPEPSTYALMLAGLGAVALVARRRRRSAS